MRASVSGSGTDQCSKMTIPARNRVQAASTTLPTIALLRLTFVNSQYAPNPARTARVSIRTTLNRLGTRLALTKGI